jgi:hypothetical protein
VLSLLSQVAEEQPLVCLIDDEQWIDRCSAQVLAFVARRLGAESVGLVFAARTPSSDLAGLPGTGRRRRPGRTRASPTSSNAAPTGRWPAAA